ncbi:MAG TPA: TadE/TadG family type IV pilus assembly protein [Candidatus Binatia bacterium]|nr:TadE/TadG family type IV pilus assembly protein [Candidatus Binatia bacterium]
MQRPPYEQLGQSLAEVAILLPILLLLIVGVVEVSQMLITQNRISTAARNAARFGAQGGEDLGIRNITLNTVTQTLDLTSGVWDIFVVRGVLDVHGDLPADNFSTEHVYGAGMTQAFTRTTTSESWEALRQEIVDKLSYPGTSPAGLKVVGVLILHDIDSILGINIIPSMLGRNTIRGFSIMRNSALATTVSQSTGCTGVYPLIVDVGTRSMTRALYDSLSFTYPLPKPSYNSFSGHASDVALLSAKEGYVFKLDVGTGPQNVGLLRWNPDPALSPPLLGASMDYPGNSSDNLLGFHEWGDSTDQEMHIGDRVMRSSEGLGDMTPELEDHVDIGRTLRLPLWDEAGGGYVSDVDGQRFFIAGFGVFRVRAFGSNWILLELFRIDNSCGQT